MQPQPLAFSDGGDRIDRIDGSRRGRPDRGDDGDRPTTGGTVRCDGGLERLRPHREVVIDLDPDETFSTDAERHARLFDRAVRLLRGVDAHGRDVGSAGQPAGGDVETGRLPGCRDRDQRRGRCRVGDETVEPVGQTEALAKPVDHDLLELGADRRGPPQHRVLAEDGGEHLAEDPRARRSGREVRHEPGMLPVRGVRHDQLLVVGQDRVDPLRGLRRHSRELWSQRPRLDRREDRPGLDRLEVVGHEVDHGMGGRAERGRIHVAETLDLLGVRRPRRRLRQIEIPVAIDAMPVARSSVAGSPGCSPGSPATPQRTAT